MKVVLVGPGRRAARLYIPWILAHPASCQLVGVVGPEASIAEARASFPALDAVPAVPPSRLGRAVAGWQPDLVIIASPDSAHLADLTRLASFPGMVLVEKPVVARETQLKPFVRAAAEVGSLRVGHNLRHLPGIDLLREDVTSASSIELVCSLKVDHLASYYARWHRRRSASGGLEVTKACHHLDLLNWFLGGPPNLVTGHLWSDPQFADASAGSDVQSDVYARLDYRGGRTATYRLHGLGSSTSLDIRAQTDHGWVTARIDDDGVSITRSTDGVIDAGHVPASEGPHGGADHIMLSSCIAGSSAGAPLEDALAAVATGFAITKSHRSRLSVAVSPIPGGSYARC